MEPTRATWIKGKKQINGWWSYYRPSDAFTVELDDRDPVTGRKRVFEVKGDHPEFNGWKLIRTERGEGQP